MAAHIYNMPLLIRTINTAQWNVGRQMLLSSGQPHIMFLQTGIWSYVVRRHHRTILGETYMNGILVTAEVIN